ncbi:MAG TPA: response regulator [Thermoanaerobaculia bacterium]|nr:response regulator [Thermoanaerobaculia bacterium]
MSHPKVLVIDDDLPMRILMQNVLREYQFTAILAGSGREALELARRERPAVILLDLNMPGMDGAETIQALRREPELASTPVMILTGDPVSPEQIDALGAQGTIQKPFDLDILIARLREATGTGS